MENQLTPVQWLSNQINTAKWKFADITDRNKIISEAIEMEKQFAKAKQMEISKQDEPINHKEIADHIFNELNKID